MAKLTTRTVSGTPAEGDLSHIVDVSDTTDNAAGTSKKLTIEDLRKAILRPLEFSAFAGGGQGSATQLTAYKNNITTVATAGDSVKMLPATEGVVQRITNSGAESLDLFPSTGNNFEGLGANVAIALGVGNSIELTCYVDGEFKS